MMRRFIEMLDCEIERLVGMEKQRGRVHMGTEQQLHILFENRKHAERWAEKHQAGHHMPATKPVGPS